MRREVSPGKSSDIPIDLALNEGLAWMARAQDHSSSRDGGVARHYCLVTGWGASYPETTGYIVPTMIREGRIRRDATLLDRARKMLDWLVRIQMPNGAFQAGTTASFPVIPVTFNTGQILLGLASGASAFGPSYRPAMFAAADWLVRTQDADGCWRKHPTPYAAPGEKAYESHVAWGLFEAARQEPSYGYADAALRNIQWCLSQQQSNGWFASCCLEDNQNPLTHTIGYALRGLVEAYRFTGDNKILHAAIRAAEGILGALQPSGFLPGRLNSQWQGTVSWSCLTGTAQISICWLLLFRETGDARFRKAALEADSFLRRSVRIDGPLATRGAVKGSYPVSGGYTRFQYPSWATKFFIDANRLEKTVAEGKNDFRVLVSAKTRDFADQDRSGVRTY